MKLNTVSCFMALLIPFKIFIRMRTNKRIVSVAVKDMLNDLIWQNILLELATL